MKPIHIVRCLAAFAAAVSLVLASAVSAQDSTPAVSDLLDGVTVRPLSDIVDGEFSVGGFANDGTASLHLVTTIPVACSVIYGKTTAFGSLAISLDMNGGAIIDHNPILSGLEPDTTYFYRLQGTDESGVIYLSPVMTFTTPPLQTAGEPNLASPDMGAEITGYSSAYGGASPDARWGVLSAVDSSQNSAWSSAGDGDNAWLEVRLAQRSHITRIEYWSRSMSDGSSEVFSFTVTTDEGGVYGPFDVPDASQPYDFDVDFEASTVRFNVVRSSGGNTGAVEFGLYGEPG